MVDFDPIRKLFAIKGNCGYTEEDLSYLQEKYGAIPSVLKQYYLELGQHYDLNNTQDFLILPKGFPEYDNLDYLIFYSENQGVWLWGIKKEDLMQDDPPVYQWDSMEKNPWIFTTQTISSFLFAQAHLQAALSMEYSNEDIWEILPEDIEQIKADFASKNASATLFTGVEFFGNHDDSVIAILKNEDQYMLMFTSRSEEHYNEMDAYFEKILYENEL